MKCFRIQYLKRKKNAASFFFFLMKNTMVGMLMRVEPLQLRVERNLGTFITTRDSIRLE